MSGFPQFGPDSFTSPGALVQSIIAYTEIQDADRPHVVIVYDPQTQHMEAFGPYPTAYVALEQAEKDRASLNDPKNNDGEPVHVGICPFHQMENE